MASLVNRPFQPDLFKVEKQIEYDGIEMGVLENGVPYLSESGLARMCGIDRKVLNRLAVNWAEEKLKPRGAQIQKLLSDARYVEDSLFLKSVDRGIEINAYTEPVCLAIVEYYAFVSEDPRDDAIKAFRTLARTTFRAFIYGAVGYTPQQQALESWRHFHDRIDLTSNAVPDGYFGVFAEIAAMIVPLIRAGVMISDKVVPDISVGKIWSTYWESEGLGEVHGERVRYEHHYPAYYPQSASNPQSSYAYPDSALGAFRQWLRQNYIANKFPGYLLGQQKKGALSHETAIRAQKALSGPVALSQTEPQ